MENTTFSEKNALEELFQDSLFSEMLEKTSSSEEDMRNRQKVYSDVMENYENLQEAYKAFSGYAEIPILSNQYFNASMASYVRSFAGYLTVERAMDQPTTLLWYNDLLGVVDNRKVLPNIGPENLKGINGRFQTRGVLTPGSLTYQLATNKKLIPGSIEIQLCHAGNDKKVTIKDDRQGNLLAPAGVLSVNPDGKPSINYGTGALIFTINEEGFKIVDGDTFTVLGFEDVAGDPAFGQLTGPGNNRFKVDMKNIQVVSEPDMLIGENNLMAIAASQKAIGMNPQEITGQKLTELYTKLVNEKLVDRLIDADMGNEFQINMSKYITKFTDYQSRLDAFGADLVNIDTLLARKTFKAVKATAYVVGEGMGNWFRKMRQTGQWTDNTDSTYINDLLGFYNGIPVLRHINVPFNTGYAVHKTPGGEIAPLMRGIYLPLTNTPLVGNYNNPSQMAQGVYYQEANESIFPELCQKFVISNDNNEIPEDPFNVKVLQ